MEIYGNVTREGTLSCIWKEVSNAIQYNIKLFFSKNNGEFNEIDKKITDRNTKWIAFIGLIPNVNTQIKYKVIVEAEGKEGKILETAEYISGTYTSY